MISCRPTRELSSVSSDSVRIERVTEYRDTTIQVPADSSWLQALIECDSNGRAYLREIEGYHTGERSKMPGVRIQDNVLKVDCKCDSTLIYLKFSKIYDHTTQTDVRKETVTVEVNRLTWWQKVRLQALNIMLIAAGVYLAIIIIKRFLI
jgi:hypothetical protein